jgi:hypothetical protein
MDCLDPSISYRGFLAVLLSDIQQITRTMRSTEHLPASRSVLGLVPRPARIAPRAGAGDRGRSAKK